MYCASEALHVHEMRSLHGALDRWVYLANWQFFFET